MSSRLCILGLVGLLGCSSYEIVALEAPAIDIHAPGPRDLGTVCVVRPHEVGHLAQAVVRDNSRLVGATQGASYFCYFAEPGLHVVVSTYGDDVDATLGTDVVRDASVVVVAGSRHYLHHDVSNPLTLQVGWLEESVAVSHIDELEYVALVEVPGQDALPPQRGFVPAVAAAQTR